MRVPRLLRRCLPASALLGPALVGPVLAGLALSGCADETPAGLPPASYMLADGTAVHVDAHGAVSLRTEDGRALTGTAAGAFPEVARYRERVDNQVGFFQFVRAAETRTATRRFLGSEQQADGSVLLRFGAESGETILLQVDVHQPDVATRLRWVVSAEEARAIALPFACDAESSFVGFGAQYDDVDQRGDAFALWVQEQGIGRTGNWLLAGDSHSTYFPMPWWLDWRGFGVLVDTDARVQVDLCQREASVAWVEVEDVAPLDVLVFHGPRPRDVVRALGDTIGRATRPPEWAFSPWIGVQGGPDAVRAEVAALEAAEVPFSAVWVQDWVGGLWLTDTIFDLHYRWVADTERYPELPSLVRELREEHDVRFLAYANPFVKRGLDHWDEMVEGDLLVRTAAGDPYVFALVAGTGSLPDFTRAEAYEYVQRHLRAMVTEQGFDGWMSDFGEWLPIDAQLHAGDARLLHNRYPELWHRASREVMDELRPDGDWVLFTRSGWTRDHAQQQIVWIGDQEADWEPTDGLPTVLPALLNLSLSDVPFVTHDIAGYSGGPSTKELYQRWTELAAFGPIFRTHEGLRPEANWSWDRDAETTAHFRRFARIHEALRPEISALADEAAATSLPIVRHLAFEFESDVASRAVDDQFLLGSELLVAPVTEEGATSRRVYLPPGRWFHVWSGEEHEGGRTIEVQAPIGAPPVFSLGRDRPDLRAIE